LHRCHVKISADHRKAALTGAILSTGIDRLYVSPRPGAKFHYKLQRYVKLHDLLLTLKTSDHVSVIFELADKPRRKRKA